jgi:hypothetical protein
VNGDTASSDTIHTLIRVNETIVETEGIGDNETIAIMETKGMGTMVRERILIIVEIILSIVEMILVVETTIPIARRTVGQLRPCRRLLLM